MSESAAQEAYNCHRLSSEYCGTEGISKRLIMAPANIKEEAHRLVENLGEDATWDDLMYQIYVRQAVDAGLEDSQTGRTIDVKEVRAKLGLTK